MSSKTIRKPMLHQFLDAVLEAYDEGYKPTHGLGHAKMFNNMYQVLVVKEESAGEPEKADVAQEVEKPVVKKAAKAKPVNVDVKVGE